MCIRDRSGTVSSDGAHFAGYPFAAGVEILDTDSSGGYARIYPSRLVGVKLPSEHVRYYTLDSSGCIDRLILDEATGLSLIHIYLSRLRRTFTRALPSSMRALTTAGR